MDATELNAGMVKEWESDFDDLVNEVGPIEALMMTVVEASASTDELNYSNDDLGQLVRILVAKYKEATHDGK